jgi:hypothetical protein
VEIIEAAGGTVQEMSGSHSPGNFGDTLFTMVERNAARALSRTMTKPIVFAVPAALWDWNASHVYQTGIGASEETIVYLGRELAKHRKTHVYGPIPAVGCLNLEETRDFVQYYPREQTRLLPANSTVIISRGPGYGQVVEKAVNRELDKILWLAGRLLRRPESGDCQAISKNRSPIRVAQGHHAQKP